MTDIPTDGLIPELAALLALWRQRYGSAPLAGRSLFQPSELQRWSRHVVWIEARKDTFRLRNFGFDMVRRFGRHAEDETVDELAPDIAAGLREILWRAMANAAPVTGAASVPLGRQAAIFCELVLPLAASAGRIELLLIASYEIDAPF
jgi:hypothetical protein